MRLIALLLVRGVPIVFLLIVIVYVFDLGGAQQPIADAYISAATALGEMLGERIADSLVPEPTPSPSLTR